MIKQQWMSQVGGHYEPGGWPYNVSVCVVQCRHGLRCCYHYWLSGCSMVSSLSLCLSLSSHLVNLSLNLRLLLLLPTGDTATRPTSICAGYDFITYLLRDMSHSYYHCWSVLCPLLCSRRVKLSFKEKSIVKFQLGESAVQSDLDGLLTCPL